MTNITKAAQDFIKTDAGKLAILPETPGVDYLDIDIVDFTGQNVTNLFDDKYVFVYIIKDLEAKNDEDLRLSYYTKGLNSSLFYPDEIRDKLKAHYGEIPVYVNKKVSSLTSMFDYEMLDESEKSNYDEYDEKTSEYFTNSTDALEKMWEPLTSEEISKIMIYTRDVVDTNIDQLFSMETSESRPYAVNVFNDSVASFIRTFPTHEECTALLARIHTDKIKVVSEEMAFI
jgi:hypothetical protein